MQQWAAARRRFAWSNRNTDDLFISVNISYRLLLKVLLSIIAGCCVVVLWSFAANFALLLVRGCSCSTSVSSTVLCVIGLHGFCLCWEGKSTDISAQELIGTRMFECRTSVSHQSCAFPCAALLDHGYVMLLLNFSSVATNGIARKNIRFQSQKNKQKKKLVVFISWTLNRKSFFQR